MLNISQSSIKERIDVENYSVFKNLESRSVSKVLLKLIFGLMIIGIISLFLPWTQNIRSNGYVSTLNPDDKPQAIQSLIAGRIEEWYVQEGEVVSKGDTILKISESKSDYLDPQLLDRTQGQINAKNESAKAYSNKARNLDEQYSALLKNKSIKLEQNELKIQQSILKLQSDSMEMVAAMIKLENSSNQLDRIENLYEKGIKSLTDLETKRLSFQEASSQSNLL